MASKMQAQEYIEEQQSQEFADEIYESDEETNDELETPTTGLDSSKMIEEARATLANQEAATTGLSGKCHPKKTASFKSEEKLTNSTK